MFSYRPWHILKKGAWNLMTWCNGRWPRTKLSDEHLRCRFTDDSHSSNEPNPTSDQSTLHQCGIKEHACKEYKRHMPCWQKHTAVAMLISEPHPRFRNYVLETMWLYVRRHLFGTKLNYTRQYVGALSCLDDLRRRSCHSISFRLL